MKTGLKRCFLKRSTVFLVRTSRRLAGLCCPGDAIERSSNRPDFLILAHPVISFSPEIAGQNPLVAHANSGRNLLGEAPTPAVLEDSRSSVE